MRLKYLMLLLVVPLTALPLGVFSLSPHGSLSPQNALMRELFDRSNQRYMLLANNLSAALERYHRDVRSVFEFVADELRSGRGFENKTILDNLNIRHVCLFDRKSGSLLAQAAAQERPCPKKPPAERWQLLRGLAVEGKTALSTVQPGPENLNVIFLVQATRHTVAAAAIYLDYIQELGARIAFGQKGHAAIVDHNGNVLYHPRREWMEERRNLASLPIVRDMLAGKQGVTRFHSPALDMEMIAGFMPVEGAGWGVMIPQPVDELLAEASDIRNYAWSVLAIGLLAASALAWMAALALVIPLSRMIRASRAVAGGEWPYLNTPSWLPFEFKELFTAFNAMVARLKAGAIHVRQLAYFDPLTGLANRAYFNRKASQYLEDQTIRDAGGHVLFVDLDGFKDINDRLGHQAGDELLAALGERLTLAYALPSPRDMCLTDPLKRPASDPPSTLVSRLGGDEFAILLPKTGGTPNAEQAGQRLQDLFAQPFVLPGQSKSSGIDLRASIGISSYPDDGLRLYDLLKKADIAMYGAKKAVLAGAAVFRDRRRDSGTEPASGQSIAIDARPSIT